MTKEKTHCANSGYQASETCSKTKKRLSEQRGQCNSISLYPSGAEFYVQPLTKGSNSGCRGDRGDIKGWSTASRRRMREFMLTHRPVDGLTLYGVTLTIPGPTLAPARAKSLFARFALHLTIGGHCAVWRLEVQGRGQLHWHLMCGTRHPGDITMLWWDTIKSMGPETFDPPHIVKGKHSSMTFDHVDSRMSLPGAAEHCVQVDDHGGRGSWLRYLQDHQSKGKQEQIGENMGRHWGVIGRKLFERVLPDIQHDLTDKQYHMILRAMQRLATPSHADPSKPFGRCLGGRVRRGSRGRSIWYSRPDTVARIVAWALALNTVPD